ncbi:GNAT family N-acetyltransferase [Stappia sp. F7233]|uniref:GNAT family N-acetyltransferase n=1 Tax=Stappia albiluteola TaxID=2758565 RepID=A0A839AFV3_9HYPH|nr:GNAT family N-acetyltransferase [Stappia albiluteola]MBA5777762.1 GNAT family N-acetyltransferase [Stappia albiluteola]
MTLRLIGIQPDQAARLSVRFGEPAPENVEIACLAEDEGHPLGLAAISAVGTDRGAGRLSQIFVESQARNRGIGGLLHDRLIDAARSKGLRRFTVDGDCGAASLLAKLGYKRVSTADGASEDLELDIVGRPQPIDGLDVRLIPSRWAFEERHGEAIEANWRDVTAANPSLWNGRVLKLAQWRLENGVFQGEMVDASFAAFLAWRDWGYPDPTIRNLFGSAVIKSADGAFVFGRMAQHTASAGLVYPPGGNLDHADITDDGRVDVEASIFRELAEETGLDGGRAERQGLFSVFDGPRISISAILAFPFDAAEIVEKIEAHNRREEQPELAGAVPVFAPDQIAGLPTPPYVRMLVESLLR